MSADAGESGGPPVITPARLARYLERRFAGDRNLRFVGVRGEVTNHKPQANGIVYFDLKDRDAVLHCVAFAERAATFPAFGNGADAIAFGEVKIWARTAIYQLTVARVELSGIGALHAQFEELRRKLDRDGLFSNARKRPLPAYPFRVALVGSPTGEGTNDFVTQARQRAPHVAIELFETPVNGVQAAPDIARAIGRADAAGADLVVVVRGGGSYEDLFGFSDERVVRAIAACATPTAAAIGHERDVTLIELAADRAASTPSKAAQTVLPRRADVTAAVRRHGADVGRAFALVLERAKRRLERIEYRSPLADADRLLAARRLTVDGLRRDAERGAERRIARARDLLARLARRLAAQSPGALLERRRSNVARLSYALGRYAAVALAPRRAALAGAARRLPDAGLRVLERRRTAFEKVALRLDGNDPEALLQRGYAIVTVGDRPLRDPADAPAGTRIEARLARGTLYARVEREATDGGRQIGLF